MNKKRHAGGMDITKLYAMAEALNVRDEVPSCFLKNRTTSYNGTPSKPGNIHFLLLSANKLIGCEVNTMRWSFVNVCSIK